MALSTYADGDSKWISAVDAIAKEYESPSRVYHDTRHLHRMFDELDCWRPELNIRVDQIAALELAIVYHDVVYVPGSPENERLSAERAVEDLRRLGLPRALVHQVKMAILATMRHVCGRHDRISRLMIDLDLCAMASPAEYTENGSRIRKEFSVFDDQDYAKGRVDFLGAMLKRRRIFRGPFADRYEQATRENIVADLARQRSHL